jgi:hypothetical protein
MKKIIILIATLLESLFAFSQQSPLKLWDKRFAGDSTDQLTCIGRHPGGSMFIGGYSNSKKIAEKSQNPKGGTDYWVIKTDSNGGKLWDMTYGTNVNDVMMSVVPTADGGCLIGGYTQGGKNNDKTLNSFGSADYWVVRLASNGAKLWDSSYGGNSYEELHYIEPCNDKGFLLVGISASGKSGNKKSPNKGDFDVWVVKIDSMGKMQWDSSYGGRGFENCYSAHQTKDGGFLIAATSRSSISGNKTQDSIGNADLWILKINGNGIVQWDKVYGGKNAEELWNFTELDDGGFVFPVNTSSDTSIHKKVFNKGYLDIWLIRTDANGNKVWERSIGGNYDDRVWAIVKNLDMGFTLGGYSGSITGDRGRLNIGSVDYWIIKTDSLGKPLWDERFGGIREDILQGMVSTPSDNLILAGYTRSGKGFDKTQDTLNGFYDYWITKVRPSRFYITKHDTLLCPNDLSYVHYNSSINFADTNKIFLQMSDGISNFQNGVTVGFKNPTKLKSDSILALIPSSVFPTPYYKFRFISTAPKDTSQWSFAVNILGVPKKPVVTRVYDTLVCSNANGVTYQWQKNNIDIQGANQRKYLVASPGYYSVRVDSFASCPVYSDPLAVNSVGIKKGTLLDIMIKPNPFYSFLEINTGTERCAGIEMFDVSGKMVLSYPAMTASIILNTESLLPGFYIVTVKTISQTFCKKVVKYEY